MPNAHIRHIVRADLPGRQTALANNEAHRADQEQSLHDLYHALDWVWNWQDVLDRLTFQKHPS